MKLFSRPAAPARSDPQPPGSAAQAVADDDTARAGGYDRVGIVKGGGAIEWMSRSQFQALPLTDRVRLLSGGEMRFYRGTVEITASEAMRR